MSKTVVHVKLTKQTYANLIPKDTKGQSGTKTHHSTKLPYFKKSSAMINNLVNMTWFCCYQRCQYIIYDNRSEFKLHFAALNEITAGNINSEIRTDDKH